MFDAGGVMLGENADGRADSRVTRNDVSAATGAVVQAGTIVGGVHVHERAPDVRVPRQLPLVSRGFVGRSEQLGVLEAGPTTSPDEASAGPMVTLVCGTAGVGKTTLVLHWAKRVSEAFPDGQLYVDLRGYGLNQPLDPSEALAGFLRAFGTPTADMPEDVAERAALYRSLLADRRVLVVLDNAHTDEQIRPLLPGSSSCRVVITSRRVLSGVVAGEGADVVQVGLLEVPDAVMLLRKLIGDRVDEEPAAATDLVGYCAGLPLALRVAGEVARSHPASSLAGLAADLADRRTRLDVLDTDDDPTTTARTVFSWSYEQLKDDVARAFRALGAYPGRDIDARALSALLDSTTRAASRYLDALVRASLVMQTGSGRFDMHDLLRVYAAELTDDYDNDVVRTEAVCRLFDYYLHAADTADRVITPHRYRGPLDGDAARAPRFEDSGSALAWLDTERHNMMAIFRASGPVLAPRLWLLAYTLRGYYFLTKQWQDWTASHELALAATQTTGNRYGEAQTRNNLGLALLEQGHWNEAADHYEKAGTLFHEVGDIHGVSNALANRATVLHYRGDYEAALQENELALSCYERTGSTRNTAITLRSMALIEIDLERFDDATKRLRHALTLFDDLGLQLDETMALNCLGEAHHQAGNTREAQQTHELALARGVECGSRFEQARAHYGLGRIATSRGDHAEAVRHWEAALEGYTALNAPESRQLDTDLTALRSASLTRQTGVAQPESTVDAPSPTLGALPYTAGFRPVSKSAAPFQGDRNMAAEEQATVDSDADAKRVRVFVSYAHESEDHKAQVLRFAEMLRSRGIDANLDQWDADSRRDWFTWMIREVQKADYVAVIPSPDYKRYGDGGGLYDVRRGIRTEAVLLRELVHREPDTSLRRLLPVVLPGGTTDDIPLFLQPSNADYYEIEEISSEAMKGLLRVLYEVPEYVRPPLGSSAATIAALKASQHIGYDESVAEKASTAALPPNGAGSGSGADLVVAHSRNDNGQWHSLGDHARSTGALAARFAQPWGAAELAEAFGLFHDAGKAYPQWQRRLREVEGTGRRVGKHEELGTRLLKQPAGFAAMAVLGHHRGLDSPSALKKVLRTPPTQADSEAEEAFFAAVPEARAIVEQASLVPQAWSQDKLLYEMGLRMTFSALVDADRLDTAAHNAGLGRPVDDEPVDMSVLVERFEKRRQKLLEDVASSPMDAVRQQVYDAAVAGALWEPGVYRLAAPTGSGKTFAQGAYALHHAAQWGKRRVVVAMPLVTVTEQNAQVYRDLLDDAKPVVLEHHSQVHVDESDETERAEWTRLAAENWDAPFVLTTTVQLFESLFGRTPSQVRKLHRLADSVLVLDEVQALPPRLLLPILDGLRLLTQHFGTTVLLTSATQPAFESLSVWRGLRAPDLINNVPELFERARRVVYEWRLEPRPTFEDIAVEAAEHSQGLIIVNSTKDSRRLYRDLAQRRDDVWHLSSRMCPRHRARVLKTIKQRLDNEKPVLLVATQIVETGVDISFPVLWRAMAPADSLQQAAGRTGRHGGPESGRMIVFDPVGGGSPPEYATRIAVTRHHFGPGLADPDNPTSLKAYYEELYGKLALDRSNVSDRQRLNAGHSIQHNREALNYRAVVHGTATDAGRRAGKPDSSKAFRMIEQNTVPVVIVDSEDDRADEVRGLVEQLHSNQGSPQEIVRALQGWVVALPIWTADGEAARARLRSLGGDLKLWTGDYDSAVGIDDDALISDTTA